MIRLSPRIRQLASVAAGTAILHGCATYRVDVPSTTRGQIAVRPGRVGYVVAAPHGTSDVNTAEMATEIARRTGFGLVVASGFSLEANGTGRRYAIYEQRVLEAAQGPLRFYAEIDGNGGAACAGQIDIATVGVDPELALRFRTLAELIRDAHLRGSGEIQKLAVVVEPVDPITSRASGATQDGILRLPERALYIELPRCARRDWRDAYTAILADFLSQAVALPIGR